MPPHLYHGVPRQQRRICVPPPQFFCSCGECCIHNYYEVQTNEIKRGQYVTEAQYKIHSRRERQQMVAVDNYQQVASGPEKAQSTARDPPAGQSANIPQVVGGGEVDSEDCNFESAREDEEVGRKEPRKVRRRRATAHPSEVLITHQLRRLADSLSVITADSFRQGFHRSPAVFSCRP
jgi:hypothetical protein